MPCKGLVLDPKLLATVRLGDEELEDSDALVGAREGQTRVCIITGVHRKLGEMCGAVGCKRRFVGEACRMERGRLGSHTCHKDDSAIGLQLLQQPSRNVSWGTWRAARRRRRPKTGACRMAYTLLGIGVYAHAVFSSSLSDTPSST